MEVYVLIGHIIYESKEFLGVYHTKADAEFARDEYDRVSKPFDCYSIQRCVIGAKAKWEY